MSDPRDIIHVKPQAPPVQSIVLQGQRRCPIGNRDQGRPRVRSIRSTTGAASQPVLGIAQVEFLSLLIGYLVSFLELLPEFRRGKIQTLLEDRLAVGCTVIVCILPGPRGAERIGIPETLQRAP